MWRTDYQHNVTEPELQLTTLIVDFSSVVYITEWTDDSVALKDGVDNMTIECY